MIYTPPILTSTRMLSKTQLQRHLSSPAVRRQPLMSSVVLTKENAANGIPLQLATLHKRFADVTEKMNQMSEHVDVLTEKMDAIENMLLKRNIAAPAPVQAPVLGMPLAAGAVRSGYQIPQAKAQAQAQAPRQSKIDDWMTVSRVTTAGVPSIPVVRSSPVVVVGQVAHGQAGAGNDDDDAKK